MKVQLNSLETFFIGGFLHSLYINTIFTCILLFLLKENSIDSPVPQKPSLTIGGCDMKAPNNWKINQQILVQTTGKLDNQNIKSLLKDEKWNMKTYSHKISLYFLRHINIMGEISPKDSNENILWIFSTIFASSY